MDLHLASPRSIDGPQIPAHEMRQAKLVGKLRNGRLDIERQVGDEHVVAMEYEAVRPEKTDRRAIFVDTAEVARLRALGVLPTAEL